jgi:hypothetical protein
MHNFFLSLLMILIITLAPPTIYAQQWTDPINISNSTDVDGFPDICVDTNGILHCVWRKSINNSTRKIYYSKSPDQGETWSNPIKLSASNTGSATKPKIVCDNNNRLYVVYKYDINNPAGENIWFTKFFGYNWTVPVTIADGYPGLFLEELTVDNNNRVYVFWRYFDHKFHYRYYKNYTWSEVFCPFGQFPDSYWINIIESKSDTNNNLHCIGRYREQEQDTLKAAYYFYDYTNDIWSEPKIIGTLLSDVFQDISVDAGANPYMVWRGVFEGPSGPDATFYKYKTANQWAETEIIVEDPWAQKIDIINNNVFLADKEKEGEIKKIIFYKKDIYNQWEGQVVMVCDFFNIHKLFHDQEYLYILISGKIDNEDILDAYIVKTPIDSLISSINKINSLNTKVISLNQNYPNPFGNATEINFELNSSGKTKLLIMKLTGVIVKQYDFGKIQKGKYNITWTGTDNKGNKLSPGIYYYRLIVDDRQKTRSLILAH